LPEKNLVYDLDTDQTFIQTDPDMPAAVKTSIADYGRRLEVVELENVTTIEQAQNWAKGYFGINAQPVTCHVVDIAKCLDVDNIEPDGQLELLEANNIESGQVVKVAFAITPNGDLKASIDLNTERPSFERLLKKFAGKGKGSGAGAGGSYAWPGGGGPGGGVTTLPGGADTQVQYNKAGVFAGDAGMTYDDSLNKLTLAGGLISPLIQSPAATALNLLPPATYPIIAGDTAGGGVYRPLVVADQAYQALSNSEALKVAIARATSVGGYLETHYLYPTGTDNTKPINMVGYSMVYTGDNISDVNSRVLRLALDFQTTGSFPSPAADEHPMCLIDCNISAGNDFTGTVADVVGVHLHPYFQSNAVSGKYTTCSMIRGTNSIAANGQVTTLNWIDLPSAAYDEVNNFLKLGNGNFLTGNVVWKSNLAATVPLAIQGYAAQSGDLLRFKNSTPTILSRFDSAGKLHLDHVGEQTSSHHIVADNIFDATKALNVGTAAQTSGIGIRAAAWTGDIGWRIYHNAADASADYGLNFTHIASTVWALTATALTCIDAFNFAFGTTTGTKLGTAANQKIGMYNVPPVVQAAHIADSAGSSSVGLAAAHIAINAILVVLENLGPVASA